MGKRDIALNVYFEDEERYAGQEPWDGARDLFGLMEYGSLPEKLRPLFNNYRIHILEIKNYPHTHLFRTDLYHVFGFLQRAGDKQAEKEFTFQHQDIFSHMEEDAYDVIAALSGSKELDSIKDQYRGEGGVINMCEAIKGMIEDGRMEGRQQGRIEKSKIAARNMFLRGMSPEDAAAICEENPELVRGWFKSWGEK